MKCAVVPRRHRAAGYEVGDFIELLAFSPGIRGVIAPSGEVQPPAALIDLMGSPPRRRGYRAVPGPSGLVGMAVVARAAQRGLYGKWSKRAVLGGEVASVHGRELDGD